MGRSPVKRSTGTSKVSGGKEESVPPGKSGITSLLRSPLVHILLIAALGFLVYSNTFHSSFHWDDSPQITQNPVVKSLKNFTSNAKGYRFNPRRFIGYLSFALNYYAGGGSVTGYHLVNLTIHLINALLLYFLVILTFETPSMRRPPTATGPPPALIALFSSLLFVSHPVQTEAVTYIVQRLASLATLFYVLSLVMFIKGRLMAERVEGRERETKEAGNLSGRKTGGHGHGKSRSTVDYPAVSRLTPFVFYFLCLVSAVLAMKTKETAFTLPVVIVLYEFIFFRSSARKKLLFLLPVALTLLIIPLSVLHTGKSLGELLSDVTQQTRVQTGMSRWTYLVTEMGVIATYIRLLFLPVNQDVDYDYPLHHSLFTPSVFLSFLFLLAIFGTAVYLLWKSRRQREPEKLHSAEGIVYYRLIAFGILWFFIALSVESSVIPIVDVIFEHRLYLPSVGFFIAITAAAFVVADRLKKEKALVTVFAIILLAFSGITYARNAIWKNETTLWEDAVLKSPGKARPHGNLGYFYMKAGRTDEARKQLLTALRLNPGYVEARTSLGNVYLMEGRKDEALREFQAALKLNPNYTEAHLDLGNLYASEGNSDEALREYRDVLKLNPDHAGAHTSMGNIYLMKGRTDEALREYRAALKLNPDDFQVHNNLGNLYFMQGRLDRAIEEYKTALKLNPDAAQTRRNLMTVYRKQESQGKAPVETRVPAQQAKIPPGEEHIKLAGIYYSQGRLDEAITEYRAFLKINPDSAEAHNNLGNVYYKEGRLGDALEEYRIALKIQPGSAELHNNLGKTYGRQGHLDKALKEFKAAVKIRPDFADAHNGLGNVYGLQGHLDKAVREYEAALKLNPGSPDAHNNLGTIYYRQGRLDKAINEFQTALKLKPDDPGISRNLQILYKKKGIKR